MFDLNKTIGKGLLLFLCSCAAVTPPEGGPRDETAPKIVSIQPQNLAKNVTTQTITLQFDEPIQVQDLQKQLLITPDAGNTFKHRINKNQLELIFEKPFEENTTYTLQFREGIKDITEGNVPENLDLTFSTGSFLDSGRVGGMVKDLMTNAPENNFTVGLYPVADTGTVKTVKPYYVTKTNESGQFNFKYIKEGLYKIYAFQDVNNNLKFNQNTEKIAYLPEPITVKDSVKTLNLSAVVIDTRKPYVTKTEAFKDLNKITISEGIRDITFLNDSLPFSISPQGNTLTLFNNKGVETINLPVTYQDSSRNTASDTLKLKFTGSKAPKSFRGYVVENNQATVSKNEIVKLNFEVPITIKDTNAIKVIEDSATFYYLKYPQEISVENKGKSISFKPVRKAKKALNIQLDSTIIRPVTNDTLSFPPLKLAVTNSSNRGSLSGKVDTDFKKYRIQILDSNKQIVKELESVNKFSLKNMWPGNYTIRVLIDENADGTWKAADPDLKTPAEKIYFYPDPITIRANWEVEDIVLKF